MLQLSKKKIYKLLKVKNQSYKKRKNIIKNKRREKYSENYKKRTQKRYYTAPNNYTNVTRQVNLRQKTLRKKIRGGFKGLNRQTGMVNVYNDNYKSEINEYFNRYATEEEEGFIGKIVKDIIEYGGNMDELEPYKRVFIKNREDEPYISSRIRNLIEPKFDKINKNDANFGYNLLEKSFNEDILKNEQEIKRIINEQSETSIQHVYNDLKNQTERVKQNYIKKQKNQPYETFLSDEGNFIGKNYDALIEAITQLNSLFDTIKQLYQSYIYIGTFDELTLQESPTLIPISTTIMQGNILTAVDLQMIVISLNAYLKKNDFSPKESTILINELNTYYNIQRERYSFDWNLFKNNFFNWINSTFKKQSMIKGDTTFTSLKDIIKNIESEKIKQIKEFEEFTKSIEKNDNGVNKDNDENKIKASAPSPSVSAPSPIVSAPSPIVSSPSPNASQVFNNPLFNPEEDAGQAEARQEEKISRSQKESSQVFNNPLFNPEEEAEKDAGQAEAEAQGEGIPVTLPKTSSRDELKEAAIQIAIQKTLERDESMPSMPLPTGKDDLKEAAIQIAIQKTLERDESMPSMPLTTSRDELKETATEIALEKISPNESSFLSDPTKRDELKETAIQIALEKISQKEPSILSNSTTKDELKEEAIQIAIKKISQNTPTLSAADANADATNADSTNADATNADATNSSSGPLAPAAADAVDDSNAPLDTDVSPQPISPQVSYSNFNFKIYTPNSEELSKLNFNTIPPITSNTIYQPNLDGSNETTTTMIVPKPPYLLNVIAPSGYSADTTMRIMMPSEHSGTPMRGGKKKNKQHRTSN